MAAGEPLSVGSVHPGTGEGFLLAFRGQSPEAGSRVRLRGLDAGASYLLVDPYTGQERSAEGVLLGGVGLPVRLAPGGSRLLRYRPR